MFNARPIHIGFRFNLLCFELNIYHVQLKVLNEIKMVMRNSIIIVLNKDHLITTNERKQFKMSYKRLNKMVRHYAVSSAFNKDTAIQLQYNSLH